MSMILDAMKRSKEGEARTSNVPTVDTVHYAPEPEPRFSRWQAAGMVASVVVLIAVVLTVMWPSDPESDATASSESRSLASPIIPSSDTAMAPASVSKGTDQRAERPAAKQVEATESITPAVAPVLVAPPRQRERPGVATSAPPSAEATTQAAKPAAGSDELRAIYQALTEEASQTAVSNKSTALSNGGESAVDNNVSPVSQELDEAPPIDFADILAAAQEELGVRPLVESSEPLLETLSQQIKDDIPSLIYSEHRYEPAGNSSVTLNGKAVKERQRVGAFTVIEILPDSVVLRWRETQFRVRARNSWVNM